MEKIALGLGSNLGDRMGTLRQAIAALRVVLNEVSVSSFYESVAILKVGAPTEWDKPYVNAVLVGETSLSPQELLSYCQKIENELGRERQGQWSPRVIDIDMLLYGTQRIDEDNLQVPHPHMLARDFVMVPLAYVAGNWPLPDLDETISQKCQQLGYGESEQLRPLRCAPRLVGIVNVTPDSFSDGGAAYSSKAAIAQAQQLVADGAAVVDVGAESTRPNAAVVSAAEEWQRLEPVLSGLVGKIDAKISVDTRHAETARKALAMGVDWINDVSAMQSDELIAAMAAHSTARYVLMHSLSVPADPSQVISEDHDAVAEVYDWASGAIAMLEAAGLPKHRILLDVGIGFGKTAAQSWQLIKQIEHFASLGCELFVGHSRKSFLGLDIHASNDERDAATLEVSRTLAATGVVGYLRVHEVKIHKGMFDGV